MKQAILHIRNNKAISLFVLLGTIILILFPVIGQAQEGTLNFYVTPEFPKSQVEGSNSYFDLNLAPNDKETLKLKIQNATNNPIKVQVTPHTAFTNVHGVVEYGKDAQVTDTTLGHSLDELIDPSELIELAGNEVTYVELVLHMPENSFEGYLAGGLRITEVKEENEERMSDEEGVAIKNEFAYVVGVVVSNSRDSVKPDIDLLDVFADQLNYRNVFSATIQNFTPAFVNRMAVEATIRRADENDVLYEANEEMMQMAPNSHFDFPISLEGDRFQSGDYVLNLKVTSGKEEWEWERPFTIDANEARAFNRNDVTIDNSLSLLILGGIALLILLLSIIIFLVLKKKKVNCEQR